MPILVTHSIFLMPGSISAEGTTRYFEPRFLKLILSIQPQRPDTKVLALRKILDLTRYAAIVPAFSCTIGTLLLMAQGSIAMLVAIYNAAASSPYFLVTLLNSINGRHPARS